MWYRLPGLTAALREAFPASARPAYVLVTTLGSATFLTFGLAVLYWLDVRRDATATVVGYGFAALGLVVALKSWFAMPRPPGAVRLIAVDGYGFPSGHATAAAVVYGGLVLEFDRLRQRRWLAVVALAIAAVSLSRVALGVHYLGDVVAGVLLGGAVLVGVRRLARGDPLCTFAVGTVPAVAAVAITGGAATALGALGGCLGGVLGCTRLDAVPPARSRIEAGSLVVLGVLFIGAVEAVAGIASVIPVASAVDDFVLVIGVLTLPAGVARLGVLDRLHSEG